MLALLTISITPVVTVNVPVSQAAAPITRETFTGSLRSHTSCTVPKTLGPKALFIGVKGLAHEGEAGRGLNRVIPHSEQQSWCIMTNVINESVHPVVIDIVFLSQATLRDETLAANFLRQTGHFSEVKVLQPRLYPYAKAKHPKPSVFAW